MIYFLKFRLIYTLMIKKRHIMLKIILSMNYENDCLFHFHVKHISDKKPTLINI